MNKRELRETLESMPCPFCTDNIDNDTLDQILFDLNIVMKDWLGWYKQGDITKDKYNEQWWKHLEMLACKYRIPYYEDL